MPRRQAAPNIQPLARRLMGEPWQPPTPEGVFTECFADPRFTSEDESDWQEAMLVCRRCDYQLPCYENALADPDAVGVRGGVRFGGTGRPAGDRARVEQQRRREWRDGGGA